MLSHVLDTITVVFLFPLCVRSFISLCISFLFHHIFCFASLFYFLFCFSCCSLLFPPRIFFVIHFKSPLFFRFVPLFLSSLLSFFLICLSFLCSTYYYLSLVFFHPQPSLPVLNWALRHTTPSIQ